MALEELPFESVNGRMDGWTDEGHKVITTAHPEHSSDELKMGGVYTADIHFPF